MYFVGVKLISKTDRPFQESSLSLDPLTETPKCSMPAPSSPPPRETNETDSRCDLRRRTWNDPRRTSPGLTPPVFHQGFFPAREQPAKKTAMRTDERQKRCGKLFPCRVKATVAQKANKSGHAESCDMERKPNKAPTEARIINTSRTTPLTAAIILTRTTLEGA